MVRYRARYLGAVACFICLTILIPRRHVKFELESDDPDDYLPPQSPVRIWDESQCPNGLKHLRLLLVVRSQIGRRENRHHVRRQVKARTECSVQPLFLFGRFTGNSKPMLDAQLKKENASADAGDILQVDDELDYRLKGVLAVQAVQRYIKDVKCTRFDQVVFGKYDAQYWNILKDNKRHYDTNWELDDCLKYAHQYDNSVQFGTTYFVARDGISGVQWTKTEQMDPTYLYQNDVVTPHNYPLMLGDSSTCGKMEKNRKLFAVIAAHSGPGNFVNRKKIRETWGSKASMDEYNCTLIFFVGHNPDLPEEEKAELIQESAKYNDIVQVDFLDSYKNMTLKQIAIMKFMSKVCRQFSYSYLLKTDDDIVIDLKSLHHYFTVTIPGNRIKPRRTIFCAHMNGPAIVPRYEDKWFVSRTDYPALLYPSYCSGAGYLITQDAVADLYQASLHVRSFWVDDTFVSGILAKAAGDIALVQLPKQHLIPLFEMKQKNFDGIRKMFIHVGQDMEEFDRFWMLLSERHKGIANHNLNATQQPDD